MEFIRRPNMHALSEKAQATGLRASLNKSQLCSDILTLQTGSFSLLKNGQVNFIVQYLNILVRALITRTSSTWVYHTMPNMSYILKTYVKHSTRVLPKDWTGNLETYSTALWPLGYSNSWLCFKLSNLGLMFVSVRDLYNFILNLSTIMAFSPGSITLVTSY